MGKTLYRNKFLIAYYDDNEQLLFVADNINEFFEFYKQLSKASKSNLVSYCSGILAGRDKSKHIKFIDVFEKHNDIFSYEDEIFIKCFPKNQTIKEKAQEAGLSVREYFRRLQLIKKLKEKNNV